MEYPHKFVSWESKWQIKFNIDKCYIMHVAHKRNPLLMICKMNSRLIEVAASHTYLGIGMNNKLSWAENISNSVSKINKVLGLLRHNLHSCSPFVKETAYKSLDRPKIEYCSSIWDPHHQEYENKLESVQRRVARFVCRDLRCQSHVSDMLRDLNWKMLEDRRTISSLTLLYNSVHSIVAINIDEHYAHHEKNKITTSMTSTMSFSNPTARRNCYRYSSIPRTVAEWNRLPATIREAPSVDTFMATHCSIKLSTNFT